MILWDLARATGIVAIALYTFSAVWGILIAGRGIQRPAKAVELHRALQGIALSAVIAHVVVLLINGHAGVGIAALLGLGGGVGIVLGAIALWIAILLPVSFALRSRRVVGYRSWRWLHYVGYPFWAVAVLHGLIIGTDTGDLRVLALYGAIVAAVIGATVWRLLGRQAAPPPRSRPIPAPGPPSRPARSYTVHSFAGVAERQTRRV